QPSSVTMTATRCHPSFVVVVAECWVGELIPPARPDHLALGWGLPRYRLFVTPAPTGPLPKEIISFLSSDTGGRLRVVPTDFEIIGDRVEAIVRLGETDRAGKYSGKILLDAADEKAPSVDLTVNVQDLVLWPL